MKQEILELNEGERDWVEENLTLMQGLVGSVVGEDNDDWMLPSNLDKAYSVWITAHNRESDDPNPVINAFGVAFGQYLVDELELDWKLVSDKQGTEIAAYGEQGEILIFPPNLVAKRYVEGQSGFFELLYGELKDMIDGVRAG